MNKRRVLFLIDSLDCGGAEKSLVSLLPRLDYSRLDVSLSVVRPGGVLEHSLPEGVRLIPFPKPSRVKLFLSNCLFATFRQVLSVLGIHRHGAELGWVCKKTFLPDINEEFDIAVAYQQGFPTYFLSQKVKAHKKIAWINTDLEKAGYCPQFNRHFYDRMSHICTVSEALHEKLPRNGFLDKNHLCIIKDILDVDLIRAMADAPIDANFKCSQISILTVGRMVRLKNYPLAVRSAKILQEKGVEFVWVFVGDGSDRRNIETLVELCGLQSRIVLAGQQVNPYPFFKHCDIYVQTSLFEGFGLTISEAKLFHKPIVTTDFPSAYDQISDGDNGLISEMTAESLAEKILCIIENPDLRERLINGTFMEENRTAETESARVNRLLLED